jgi:hypothetical protein
MWAEVLETLGGDVMGLLAVRLLYTLAKLIGCTSAVSLDVGCAVWIFFNSDSRSNTGSLSRSISSIRATARLYHRLTAP